MATKKCLLCKEDKSLANFIGIRSQLLNGTMPICRKCIANLIAKRKDEDRWNIVNKLCQLADIPFVPEEFEKIYKAHGTDAFGNYCYIFREKPYCDLDWSIYNEAYLQLKKEERLEDGLPEIKAEKQRNLRNRWGQDYDEEELIYLENLYQGIVNTTGIVGALNEDQVLKLCKVSLIIEQKIRAGVEFDKDLKAYNDLCKQAGISTQTIKEGSEFNSIGEVWAYLEKLGYKVKYYDGATRDEVDKTMKDIQYWTRYLYINETGIADEIAERIENLKTADKLTNSGFDWGEYEQFADEVDDNEVFDLDI